MKQLLLTRLKIHGTPLMLISIMARLPTMRTTSTNLSVPGLKRDRLLPPCFCEFPPGFGAASIGAMPTDFVSCSTQTHDIDVSSQFVQTVSEEGSSHLTDDGWTDTQKQISEIRESITDLCSYCLSNGKSEGLNEVGDLHSPERFFSRA